MVPRAVVVLKFGSLCVSRTLHGCLRCLPPRVQEEVPPIHRRGGLIMKETSSAERALVVLLPVLWPSLLPEPGLPLERVVISVELSWAATRPGSSLPSTQTSPQTWDVTYFHDGDANVLVSTVVEPLLGPFWGALRLPTAEGPLVSVWPHTGSKPVVSRRRDARLSAAVQEPSSHAEEAVVRTWTASAFTPSVSSGILLNKYLPSSYGPNSGRKTGWQCGPPS